jgi:flagella basal body P-ring formation protein FlgA
MNEKITKDDVKAMRMETRDVADTLGSTEEAVGMLARRPIAAGTVIKREYLKPQVIVKRGERIVVSVENDRLKVKSMGTALETARAAKQFRSGCRPARRSPEGSLAPER